MHWKQMSAQQIDEKVHNLLIKEIHVTQQATSSYPRLGKSKVSPYQLSVKMHENASSHAGKPLWRVIYQHLKWKIILSWDAIIPSLDMYPTEMTAHAYNETSQRY